jgi:hypothetical protein
LLLLLLLLLLAGDTREVLGLLGELLQQPALPADKLSLVQAQIANIISHRDDNALNVARRCGDKPRLSKIGDPRSWYLRCFLFRTAWQHAADGSIQLIPCLL